MENGLFGITSIIAIFLPLFFALYLLFAKLSLTYVNKNILNYGGAICSIISLLLFTPLLIFKFNPIKYEFNFIDLEKFTFNFGISIPQIGLIPFFLFFVSLCSLFLFLYSKFYFDKNKNYIFTKQRFYTFLSFLTFLFYVFFTSPNLIQTAVSIILISSLIFIFSYFDIFKTPTNHNILRFYRLDLIGNFAFLLVCLILFKFSVLSQGYITSNSLDYRELPELISYSFGICSDFELFSLLSCFALAIICKFSIFPFSCYWGFYSNSSNLLYLSSTILANNLIACFLILEMSYILNDFPYFILFLKILTIVSVIFSIIQILFEKNIKIIIGYLSSAINSIFIFSYFQTTPTNQIKIILPFIYLSVMLCLAFILAILFYFNKTTLKSRIINKQIGFPLEKFNITLFESIPYKTNKFFTLLDEKIVQNFLNVFIIIFNYLTSFFVIKTIKKDEIKCVKNILLFFAFFAIIAVFIALFGRH